MDAQQVVHDETFSAEDWALAEGSRVHYTDCAFHGVAWSEARLVGVHVHALPVGQGVTARAGSDRGEAGRPPAARGGPDRSRPDPGDLWGADLSGARLADAVVKTTDLRGADLGGVELKGVDINGAKIDLGQAVLFATAYGAVVSG